STFHHVFHRSPIARPMPPTRRARETWPKLLERKGIGSECPGEPEARLCRPRAHRLPRRGQRPPPRQPRPSTRRGSPYGKQGMRHRRERDTMKARQAVVLEPHKVAVREVELPPPGANQILVAAEVSAVSAGTELAVYTGTHQWLKDPNLPDWKFPFRPGYSAAGTAVAVGADVSGWKPGDRASYPGNHASAELLTLGHERGRLWKLPAGLATEKAAWACVARYGMGGAIRAGLTLRR